MPFPSPGDLPNPGIEPEFFVSPALAGELFTTSATWELGIKHASLVTQMVKNLPEMQETWVGPPGWEDPLEEGMATHSSIPAWRIPMDRGASRATVHVIAKGRTKLSD